MFVHHVVLTSIKAAQRLDEQIEGCVSDSRDEPGLVTRMRTSPVQA